MYNEWGITRVHRKCKRSGTGELPHALTSVLTRASSLLEGQEDNHVLNILRWLARESYMAGVDKERRWILSYITETRSANNHIPGVEILRGIEGVLGRRTQNCEL